MNLNRPILVLVGAILMSSGCKTWEKADNDAREVALQTSQRVLTIREELKAKIAAEQKFYKSQLGTIEKAEVRADENQLERERIENGLKQADEIIEKKGKISSATIVPYLLEGSTNALEKARLIRQNRREQKELGEKSLRELQLLEAQYDSLNKTLLQLATPATARDQMDQVASFIKNTANNYKRLKQEAETKAKSEK